MSERLFWINNPHPSVCQSVASLFWELWQLSEYWHQVLQTFISIANSDWKQEWIVFNFRLLSTDHEPTKSKEEWMCSPALLGWWRRCWKDPVLVSGGLYPLFSGTVSLATYASLQHLSAVRLSPLVLLRTVTKLWHQPICVDSLTMIRCHLSLLSV